MDGSQVGSMVGLALNGILCDKIGYKKTYFIALVMMTSFIFLPFFAPNNGVLLAGQILSGIPWGEWSSQSFVTRLNLIHRNVSNTFRGVRIRSLSCCSSWLPDNLRKHLLGYRTSSVVRRLTRLSQPIRPMGISHSVCTAMGVHSSHCYWRRVCSGGEWNPDKAIEL